MLNYEAKQSPNKFGDGERDFVKSNKIVDLWGYNEYEFTEQLSFRKRGLVCL